MKLVVKTDKVALERVLKDYALKVISEIEPEVTSLVDSYVSEVHGLIGTHRGDVRTSVAGAVWEPLSVPYNRRHDRNFWYKSGALENQITISYKLSKTGMAIVAGVAPESPAYQKTVWNEFGFFPHDGDRLIRRPLFVPLAEEHVRTINDMIKDKFAHIQLELKLKVTRCTLQLT